MAQEDFAELPAVGAGKFVQIEALQFHPQKFTVSRCGFPVPRCAFAIAEGAQPSGRCSLPDRTNCTHDGIVVDLCSVECRCGLVDFIGGQISRGRLFVPTGGILVTARGDFFTLPGNLSANSSRGRARESSLVPADLSFTVNAHQLGASLWIGVQLPIERFLVAIRSSLIGYCGGLILIGKALIGVRGGLVAVRSRLVRFARSPIVEAMRAATPWKTRTDFGSSFRGLNAAWKASSSKPASLLFRLAPWRPIVPAPVHDRVHRLLRHAWWRSTEPTQRSWAG